jgi:hypothetical protein
MLRSVISIGVGRLSGATIKRSDKRPIGDGRRGDHAAKHDPFALREIKRASALEDDVKAQRDERVDGAVAEAGKKELKRRGACTSGTHLVLTVESVACAREARRPVFG